VIILLERINKIDIRTSFDNKEAKKGNIDDL
jgi:hypothetical protein